MSIVNCEQYPQQNCMTALSNMRTLIIEVEYDSTPSPYRTSHSTDPYLQHFASLRSSLMSNLQGVVPINVVAKAPPKSYRQVSSKTTQSLYLDSRHSRLVYFPRKDSFEVSIDGFVVFSRLQSGGWPDIQHVTEWAFRVTEKMIDLQIEKETNNKQAAERKQQVRKMYSSSSNSKPLSPQELAVKEPPQPVKEIAGYEPRQLPALYTPVEQANRNPFPATRGKMRYSDVRKQAEETLVPVTINQGQMFRRTQRNIGRPSRRLSQQNQTINYSNQHHQRAEPSGFTWNFEVQRDISMRKTTTKVNPGNPRQSQYRRNGYELSPIVKPEQRSRVQSVRQTPDNGLKKVEIRLSHSVLNCFMDKYNVEGNRVSKRRDDGWWPILTENSLPMRGNSYFSVLMVRSGTNKLQLGLAPLTYYPNSGSDHMDGLLSFDYNTGCIRDSKLNDTAHKTAWRHGGQPPPPGKFLARVTVDMENKYVDWYADQKLCASAKIPLFFSQGGCRAFLSLYSARDLVLLNDETHESEIVSPEMVTPQKQPQPETHSDARNEQELVKQLARKGSIRHQMVSPVNAPNKVSEGQERNPNEKSEEQFGFGGSMVSSFTQTTPNRGRIRKQKSPQLMEQAINTEQIVILDSPSQQEKKEQAGQSVEEVPQPVIAFEEIEGVKWVASFLQNKRKYELYHSSEKIEQEEPQKEVKAEEQQSQASEEPDKDIEPVAIPEAAANQEEEQEEPTEPNKPSLVEGSNKDHQQPQSQNNGSEMPLVLGDSIHLVKPAESPPQEPSEPLQEQTPLIRPQSSDQPEQTIKWVAKYQGKVFRLEPQTN